MAFGLPQGDYPFIWLPSLASLLIPYGCKYYFTLKMTFKFLNLFEHPMTDEFRNLRSFYALPCASEGI